MIKFWTMLSWIDFMHYLKIFLIVFQSNLYAWYYKHKSCKMVRQNTYLLRFYCYKNKLNDTWKTKKRKSNFPQFLTLSYDISSLYIQKYWYQYLFIRILCLKINFRFQIFTFVQIFLKYQTLREKQCKCN